LSVDQISPNINIEKIGEDFCKSTLIKDSKENIKIENNNVLGRN